MLETINGVSVYVVEFDTMPELPIIGLTEEEARKQEYQNILAHFSDPFQRSLKRATMQGETAYALTQAIETGVITEPGKYGIHIDDENHRWEVFALIEE